MDNCFIQPERPYEFDLVIFSLVCQMIFIEFTYCWMLGGAWEGQIFQDFFFFFFFWQKLPKIFKNGLYDLKVARKIIWISLAVLPHLSGFLGIYTSLGVHVGWCMTTRYVRKISLLLKVTKRC